MAAAASMFRSAIMVALSITSRPDRSPIARPAGKPSVSELQVKPVAAERQCQAFAIGEGEIKLVAGTAANVVQRHAQCGRGLFGIHAEGKRGPVWRNAGALLRARAARDRQHQRQCGVEDQFPYQALQASLLE